MQALNKPTCNFMSTVMQLKRKYDTAKNEKSDDDNYYYIEKNCIQSI